MPIKQPNLYQFFDVIFVYYFLDKCINIGLKYLKFFFHQLHNFPMYSKTIYIFFIGIIFFNILFSKIAISQNFDKENYNFSISEEVSVGSTVGNVIATAENTITYSISAGNTISSFSINSNTGNITTAKRLNYHTQSQYKLTVKATDSGNSSDEAIVTITINKKTGVPSFSTITWTTAANHPDGTHESQGRSVGGKLYVFGGFDIYKQPSNWTPTKRSYVYDPETNKFSPIEHLPYTPNGENFGGISHAGITTDGNDIYFAGGYTSNNAGTGQIFGTKQAWKYNVATNTYSSLPDLPVAIAAGQMEYVNGKLHHISGTNVARNQDLADHYVLDLDDISAGWKTMAPLPNPRQHAGSTVFEGKIYFIGGQKGHDQHLVTQKDVHVYDPSINEWEKVADLLTPAGTNGIGHITSAVVNLGDRIIVLGGETGHNSRTNLVSAYSPSEDQWTALTPLPQNIMAGVASVFNNKIFYLGGDFRKTNRLGTPVIPTNPTPVITITKPAANDSFKEGTEILIEAEATISDGSISKVEFFADNNKIGEDSTLPYAFTWKEIEAGTYLLSVKAVSSEGVTTTSSNVEVTVTSNIPPTIQISSPEDGTVYSAGESVVIKAEADDTDGTIEKVEFYQGSTKLGEDNEAPYEFSWNDAAAGSYNISVKATDNEGAKTTSSAIGISVLNPDNIYPEVSIIYPGNESVFIEGGILEISAEASDEDGSIEKVVFYNGSTKLGEVLSPPYTYLWNNIPSGTYQLTALAFDNEDASTESDPVTIEVEALISCLKTGSLLREYWLDIAGSNLSSIPFEDTPSGTTEILDFATPTDFADNYGTRIRGYICPPANGAYTFWISSSHNSELWISSNEDPAKINKIASSTGNLVNMWEHHGSQKSEPINLIAGQLYYVEAIHLAQDGEDHFAVGWQWPNEHLERPISGNRLIKYESGVVTDNKKPEAINILKVYPVPAPNKFFIELNSLKNDYVKIEVLNLQGKVINEVFSGVIIGGQPQRFEVERNNFSSGVYFVKLTSPGTHQVKKIIIQ